MKKSPAIPKGAEAVQFVVDPDPAGVAKRGGWKEWQREIARQMKEEGMIVKRIDGTTFEGYYFPDKIKPRMWLKSKATKKR